MTNALSPPNKQFFKPMEKNIRNDISIFENTGSNSIRDIPPNWANGNFSGVWGLDIWGEQHIPLGWMFGYFKLSINIGYFAAGLAFFGETEISWFMQGYIFGLFMFGYLEKNDFTNESFIVGIVKTNETDYYWRVIGEEGPTFFMTGKYTIFN